MRRLIAGAGRIVSYERRGSGPPLVLVHGGFSDHLTNWQFVQPLWDDDFTMFAIARPGRGETPAVDRDLEDEAADVVAILERLGEPAFLLGHSYGGHVSLAAAAIAPGLVRKLVLYEPPWISLIGPRVLESLEAIAARDWGAFAASFFHDVLQVPREDLDSLRRSPLWRPIVDDAPASLADLRTLSRYRFRPDDFIDLRVPVLLQIGSESRRRLYATDALRAVLANSRIGELRGQAHEGMTTNPEQYARAVRSFLLGAPARRFEPAETR
jgi:pimeloyl-ACP methyl ester carboxylesterase